MTIKIQVKNLHKIFGGNPERAYKLLEQGYDKESILDKTGLSVGVNNVDLTIHEGEIFVIMGLSGSGKSTLVRLLNRLITPSRGQVLIDGQDIAQVSDKTLRDIRRSKISMVFQSFALMPHMTVIDNTAFGMALAGVEKTQRLSKALEALRQVGLEKYAYSWPDQLSGGMRQRVGLARALANDPDILLMDEAFSALDPLIRTEMQDELVKLQSQQQRTIVFISHDLDEAMRIGDRIAIMQNGQVVQVGTPDEILNQPANTYVETFFRGVDISQVFSAKDIAKPATGSIIHRVAGLGPKSALKLLTDQDRDYGYVLNKQHYGGIVTAESLQRAAKENLPLEQAYLSHLSPVGASTSLSDLFAPVADAPCALPVVDETQQFLGIISKSTLLKALNRETVNL